MSNIIPLYEDFLNEAAINLESMFRELESFIKIDQNYIDKASTINAANDKTLKSLISDWKSGKYDEDPEILYQSLKHLTNGYPEIKNTEDIKKWLVTTKIQKWLEEDGINAALDAIKMDIKSPKFKKLVSDLFKVSIQNKDPEMKYLNTQNDIRSVLGNFLKSNNIKIVGKPYVKYYQPSNGYEYSFTMFVNPRDLVKIKKDITESTKEQTKLFYKKYPKEDFSYSIFSDREQSYLTGLQQISVYLVYYYQGDSIYDESYINEMLNYIAPKYNLEIKIK